MRSCPFRSIVTCPRLSGISIGRSALSMSFVSVTFHPSSPSGSTSAGRSSKISSSLLPSLDLMLQLRSAMDGALKFTAS